ncbi:MlaA family lipoprotein [Colwellia hornerae]|uniref:VacJ family lipoprotein n=1 Tax=Colwellia hornerae TaxID=89402 RepID=A0A5C6Q8T1_9GAMM|nr:VacJ family lipoprotein [Colwellia hornerae]TWX53067.1 VacJ family lipoprotein [Colwellia hornerae]TWX59330.1 VacJ family lipoprotein [Colwellia hornerae]TWX65454.1 VacJ family lipoprotein [Colwellia hornerae]
MAFYNSLIKKSVIILVSLLSGCSSVPELENNVEAPRVKLSLAYEKIAVTNQYADPWEGFNRRMYYFNAKADQYLLLPVVAGYKAITPDLVEKAVSNFFKNLGEFAVFINALLQGKANVAVETFGRFVVNTTLGVFGVFDVATTIGLDEQNEDFGQTLGVWGVASGPYLVLPLLGPSSLRDATGAGIDMFALQTVIDELGVSGEEEILLSFLRSIDTRANLPFRYYASGSAFEYERLKVLYMKYREIQIAR